MKDVMKSKMTWVMFAVIFAAWLIVRVLFGVEITLGFVFGMAFMMVFVLLSDRLSRPKPKAPPRAYGKPLDPFQ